MTQFRRLLHRHRVGAAWLIALALAMKILIPAGFMPVATDGTIVVQLCSGTGPQTMVMSMPGMKHDGEGKGSPHQKAEMPCAFSGLSAPSLAATDPILLATAILFILALGFRASPRIAAAAPAYLRPPSQGPPTYA